MDAILVDRLLQACTIVATRFVSTSYCQVVIVTGCNRLATRLIRIIYVQSFCHSTIRKQNVLLVTSL
jgi:hypothetical protein